MGVEPKIKEVKYGDPEWNTNDYCEFCGKEIEGEPRRIDFGLIERGVCADYDIICCEKCYQKHKKELNKKTKRKKQ